jgi:hypothetical protein
VTFITVKRDFAGMALSCQKGKGCKIFSTACSIFSSVPSCIYQTSTSSPYGSVQKQQKLQYKFVKSFNLQSVLCRASTYTVAHSVALHRAGSYITVRINLLLNSTENSGTPHSWPNKACRAALFALQLIHFTIMFYLCLPSSPTPSLCPVTPEYLRL